MSEAAVKQYLRTAPLKELDVLEEIIAERREKAEIDAILAERIAKIDSGKAKLISAEEFAHYCNKLVEDTKRKQKCTTV
jgi:hypothetical protein